MSIMEYNLDEIAEVFQAMRHHPGTTDSISRIAGLAILGEVDHLEFGLVETWFFSALDD